MRSLISGCLEEDFFAIHSFTVTHSGCLFGPPSHTDNSLPLQGEKIIPMRRKFAFYSTWELFENNDAGNSQF